MTKYFFLGILFIVAFIAMAFMYVATTTSPYAKPTLPGFQLTGNSIDEPIQTNHITYFLVNAVEAYKLHTPPGSQELPRIETIIDGKVYTSEIKEGKVTTEEGPKTNPDLRFILSKEELFNTLKSENPKEYLKHAVSEGKITIEQTGSYSQIFYKGYLNLYKDITGKSLTGNLINIIQK